MAYTQDGRRLVVKTPLGKDDLLLVGFSGREGISQPFLFQLECVAENATKIPFDSVLGKKVTVQISLPGGSKRWVNGVCYRIAQGARDATFTRYLLDLVPEPFLLSRKTQSRIFQHVSIPDILKKVLKGLDVTWEIKGTFQPRDYCVQYRESDFAFASRLMEEEGIYYFFKHKDGSHPMVVANTPGSHSDISPGPSNLIFEAVGGGTREEDRVSAWEKAQELRASKVKLWDHCFELPHKNLEAPSSIPASVTAGKSSHLLQLSANAPLELYDFPGAYAQRFDGISKGGGEQPAEIQKIFQDNSRTADLRAQTEASASILVHAASNCRQIVSGHKFTLSRHFEGDGSWVVYQVGHTASEAADLRSGVGGFTYQNHFSCFPVDLPFRPPRVTPTPTVRGTQTAVVVGPSGEEIFTDKYGRIKVQFHWDREGKKDTDSSCWVRVATSWAGQRWGAVHIPRIGQEVVVDFLEGDMDQPIVIGSVYNAECMPPYDLPSNKTQSGIKSRSTLQGTPENFNELRFEDKKGDEEVYFHAEKNFTRIVENNDVLKVGFQKKDKGDQSIEIHNDQTIHVGHDRHEQVDNEEKVLVQGQRRHDVEGDDGLWVAGSKGRAVRIENGDHILTIDKGDNIVEVKMGDRKVTLDMGDLISKLSLGNVTTKADLGKIEYEALQSVELKVGQSSIKIDQMGVTISGMMVKMEGQVQAQVKGLMTQINGDAMLQLQGGLTMIG